MRLSGSLHVTSIELFHDFVLMHSSDERAGNSDAFIVGMSEHMKKNFSKYSEDKEDLNNLLFIVLILDPRYKVKFISFFLGDLWSNKDKGAYW